MVNMGDVLTTAFLWEAGKKIVKLGVILVGAELALHFSRLLIDRFFFSKTGARAFYFEEKRANTLSSLLKNVVRYALYFMMLVMILQEFSIDTTSIVAGAGVIGLALGVGAQSLIKDVITGFFIIFEDQYAVGDYIVAGEMAGTVEDMGLRITKLRDANGVLHIIPNGAIARLSNYTRGHMQAVINVPVPYEADIDKVLNLLERACREIGAEMEEVVEVPKVLGVVDFHKGEAIIRLIAKTKALEQVKVETTLRRRIKVLLDEAQIPQSTLARPMAAQAPRNDN
ncbi:MAG: MscS Mechanosensitive ion channel [Firmicutes bacterium]|nr:MscS Mechanosensitive ion channel [Bacillota bacterium]